MALLEKYVSSVREIVKESNSIIYDSGENVYEDFVRRALRRYSLDKPFTKVNSFAGASSEYFIVDSSNLPGFIDNWSTILLLEAKAPTIASNDDPQFLDRDQWDFYRNSTALYVRFKDTVPSSSDTISVTYTIPHTINNLDSETTDTVPEVDQEAIVLWACNEACRMLASKFTGTSDPTIRADVVNYKTKASEFRAMSKEFREAYTEWISNPLKGESIVRDIDFGFGFSDNQPFLSHRSFSNR